MTWHGALMVCGTTSDAGKSTLVTGLCRLLARNGVRVAPFKAQNMALNAAVTPSGHEIGRAQAAQAQAAGVDPEVAMNPILLKPTGDQASQVVVEGRPWATLDAATYQRRKPGLLPLVLDHLAELRRRYDVVLCEGAGSPAEINLLEGDLVNLSLADRAGMDALVVGDIERGGVFASLYGTVALLPDHLRARVGGFIINKFRGDPALLGDGPADLERRCGVPTLGVLPWTTGLGLDAEDSLGLRAFAPSADGAHGGDQLDVAVVRLPRVSNFTDIEALAVEPGVGVRLVDRPEALGTPDLLVLPGTKATVADLAWLRLTGLAAAIQALPQRTSVVGVCGGHQMLGRSIDDPNGVETQAAVEGLKLLGAQTVFHEQKVTRLRTGRALGQPVAGYQIHHGRTTADRPWVTLDGGEPEGNATADGRVVGTSLHGLWDGDAFRAAFLAGVAERAGRRFQAGGVSFAAARQARFDRIADLLETHIDLVAVEKLVDR